MHCKFLDKLALNRAAFYLVCAGINLVCAKKKHFRSVSILYK